ncbi:uncharacterized protein LOC121857917 [Homarus americanus]|nr:uncharacterized protein LOC121857917 [Homarus americanus]
MMQWELRSVTKFLMVVVTMTTVVMASVPGPNDRRYPDYIVKPQVECMKEGVFPHPRNCSWYFSCVDRMKVGFYSTFYFECEPGTVFNDGLDQCVFPYLISPPCGTNGTGSSTTVKPPVLCQKFDSSSCQVYELCKPLRTTKTLCTGCFTYFGYTMAKDLCKMKGELLDKNTHQCVQPPTGSDLCRVTSTTTFPPPTVRPPQRNLGCTEQNKRPYETWIGMDHCQDYNFCTPSNTYLYQKKLCREYFQCFKMANGFWDYTKEKCDLGELYSYKTNGCVKEPRANELCNTSP